jgi:hypothetical protein
MRRWLRWAKGRASDVKERKAKCPLCLGDHTYYLATDGMPRPALSAKEQREVHLKMREDEPGKGART